MKTCTMSWHTCRRFVRALRMNPYRHESTKARKRASESVSCFRVFVADPSRHLACCLIVAFASYGLAHAQGLAPGALLKPPADSWPTYHGDYPADRPPGPLGS